MAINVLTIIPKVSYKEESFYTDKLNVIFRDSSFLSSFDKARTLYYGYEPAKIPVNVWEEDNFNLYTTENIHFYNYTNAIAVVFSLNIVNFVLSEKIYYSVLSLSSELRTYFEGEEYFMTHDCNSQLLKSPNSTSQSIPSLYEISSLPQLDTIKALKNYLDNPQQIALFKEESYTVSNEIYKEKKEIPLFISNYNKIQ